MKEQNKSPEKNAPYSAFTKTMLKEWCSGL